MTENRLALKKLFAKTAFLQTAVLLGALVVLGLAGRGVFRELYLHNLSEHLTDFMGILMRELPPSLLSQDSESQWCAEMARGTQFRISIVSSADGHVLCDNVFKPEPGVSILDRPEIQAALRAKDHRGHSHRLSRGLRNTQGVYSTIHLPERKLILRAGLTLAALEGTLASFDTMFLVAAILLSVGLTAILQWTTRGVLFEGAARAVDQSRKQMQEDLVANVSHEFRTPLTSIRGFADAAIQDLKSKNPPQLEFLEIIRDDANRLLTMVEDLLDLSVIDSGAIELSCQEISVREVTDEALKRLSILYGDKNFEISAVFNKELAFADFDRMLQVLLNLLGNSMKYCPSGSAIRIEWGQGKVEGSTSLVVSDNGPGIPVSAQERIFQRFMRVSDGSAKTQGAGLGLAIVKGLIDAQQGTIALESSSGQGTRFSLQFPGADRS